MAGFLPVSEWRLFPEGNGLFVIAGPCSAESRQQVLSAAEAVKPFAGVFRAGLWKPRTHPGGFEGVGEEGLEWLLEARSRTGLKICTEVGSAAHVRACISAGVDLIWIGARTTSNPFQVQEIADALAGTNIPIFVKNPASPDLDLWSGAIERLAAAVGTRPEDKGASRIAAVLRGFKTLDRSVYRNTPVWEMAARLQARFPGLTVFADPSHMAGDSNLVAELAQRALDLGIEGLMLEVHPKPEEALSDSSQQLSPEGFAGLMKSLHTRSGAGSAAQRELEELRSKIDSIDSRLLSLLAERMEVSSQIGLVKSHHQISILQAGRWDALLTSLKTQASALGLDSAMVERLFNIIHEYSIKKQ